MFSAAQNLIAPAYQSQQVRKALQKEFQEHQYVYLPNFLGLEFLGSLHKEVLAIENARIERNFTMPGHNTPRYMHTIGGSLISQKSPFLMSFYANAELRSFLSDVADNEIYACTHPSEFMVGNFLEDVGATHGWHLDDPAYGLIIVLEAPLALCGGLLEYIPRWAECCNGIQPTMYRDTEALVAEMRKLGKVKTRHHASGDAFLLKADEALHRVTPFRYLIQRRVILNLAYQNTAEQSYGNTASLLYD